MSAEEKYDLKKHKILKRMVFVLSILFAAALTTFAVFLPSIISSGTIDEVKSIELVSKLSNEEYYVGQNLDLEGFKVKITYVSERSKIIDVTPDMVQDYTYITSEPGTKAIQINYGGVSLTVEEEIVVHEPELDILTAIEVLGTLVKSNYIIGQAFDPAGLTIKEIYFSGSEVEGIPVQLDMITSGSPTANVGNDQTIELTVTHMGKTGTKNVTITVVENIVTAITMQTPPTKTEYYVGNTAVDVTGFKIVITRLDGTTAEVNVTADMVQNFTTSESGTSKPLTVKYEDYAKSFNILTVKEDSVTGIELNKDEETAKTTYVKNEALVLTGLTLSVTYASGRPAESPTNVTSAMITNLEGLTATIGNKTVNILYEGQTESYDITVSADPNAILGTFVILENPTKTSYVEIGSSIILDGLKIRAFFNDETVQDITYSSSTSEEDVENYITATADFSKAANDVALNITYKGLTIPFNILTVTERVVSYITFVAPAEAPQYYQKELIDPRTFNFIIHYEDISHTLEVTGLKLKVDAKAVTANIGENITIDVMYGGITYQVPTNINVIADEIVTIVATDDGTEITTEDQSGEAYIFRKQMEVDSLLDIGNWKFVIKLLSGNSIEISPEDVMNTLMIKQNLSYPEGEWEELEQPLHLMILHGGYATEEDIGTKARLIDLGFTMPNGELVNQNVILVLEIVSHEVERIEITGYKQTLAVSETVDINFNWLKAHIITTLGNEYIYTIKDLSSDVTDQILCKKVEAVKADGTLEIQEVDQEITLSDAIDDLNGQVLVDDLANLKYKEVKYIFEFPYQGAKYFTSITLKLQGSELFSDYLSIKTRSYGNDFEGFVDRPQNIYFDFETKLNLDNVYLGGNNNLTLKVDPSMVEIRDYNSNTVLSYGGDLPTSENRYDNIYVWDGTEYVYKEKAPFGVASVYIKHPNYSYRVSFQILFLKDPSYFGATYDSQGEEMSGGGTIDYSHNTYYRINVNGNNGQYLNQDNLTRDLYIGDGGYKTYENAEEISLYFGYIYVNGYHIGKTHNSYNINYNINDANWKAKAGLRGLFPATVNGHGLAACKIEYYSNNEWHEINRVDIFNIKDIILNSGTDRFTVSYFITFNGRAINHEREAENLIADVYDRGLMGGYGCGAVIIKHKVINSSGPFGNINELEYPTIPASNDLVFYKTREINDPDEVEELGLLKFDFTDPDTIEALEWIFSFMPMMLTAINPGNTGEAYVARLMQDIMRLPKNERPAAFKAMYDEGEIIYDVSVFQYLSMFLYHLFHFSTITASSVEINGNDYFILNIIPDSDNMFLSVIPFGQDYALSFYAKLDTYNENELTFSMLRNSVIGLMFNEMTFMPSEGYGYYIEMPINMLEVTDTEMTFRGVKEDGAYKFTLFGLEFYLDEGQVIYEDIPIIAS